MVHYTCLLCDWLSSMENDEVWNAAHIEPSCQCRIKLCINLHDNRSSGHVRGCACNLRRCHPAGTAPGGPEIDQHGNVCVLDNFSEQLWVNFQRLIQRRK